MLLISDDLTPSLNSSFTDSRHYNSKKSLAHCTSTFKSTKWAISLDFPFHLQILQHEYVLGVKRLPLLELYTKRTASLSKSKASFSPGAHLCFWGWTDTWESKGRQKVFLKLLPISQWSLAHSCLSWERQLSLHIYLHLSNLSDKTGAFSSLFLIPLMLHWPPWQAPVIVSFKLNYSLH